MGAMVVGWLATMAMAGQPPVPPAPTAPPPARVAFPHPLITEILYAVPTGPAGDASGDGVRDATGDEFIELVNPHERPIRLGGYRIADRAGVDLFVFPALELQPGQVALVFNGHGTAPVGPFSDATRAPEPSEAFHGAFVFSMRATNARAGFANSGDAVVLLSPAGEVVGRIAWGDATEPAPGPVESAPGVAGRSIQRATLYSELLEHPGDRLFSPGLAVLAAPGAEPPGGPVFAPVAYPNPLITEILFDVPRGPVGDASGDGAPDPIGDEFVELLNPHDRPISLKGFTLADGAREGPAGLRFTFPDLTLPPGGRAVVFNGKGQAWSGPVGTGAAAPSGPNDRFSGAYVLVMVAEGGRQRVPGWPDAGGMLLLGGPEGTQVECVWWGTAAPQIPAVGPGLIARAPVGGLGSVARTTENLVFRAHADLDAARFSPGRHIPEPRTAPGGNPTPGPGR